MQGGWLLAFGAWYAADLRQAGVDAVAEQAQVLCGRLIGYGGQAGIAGEVGLVDEGAQLAGYLAGPRRRPDRSGRRPLGP